MKILILSSVSIKSGSGLRMKSIAEHLAKMGHEVWITGRDIGKINGVKTIKIKKSIRIFTYFNGIRMGTNVLKNKFDVVIASKAHPVSCIPILIKKPKSKLILDFDDLEHAYWKGTPPSFLMRLFENMVLGKFDIINVHNDYLREYLVKKGIKRERIFNLPQGIECSLFKGIRKRRTDKKIIIYMAHLGIAAKDPEFVLGGIKLLSRKRKDIMLLILGAGSYLEHYKKISMKMGIENFMRFEGYVDHSKIPEYLSIASAAINYMKPTEANKSRSSIKIREYLAMRVPVVCNIFGPDLSQFKKFVFDFKSNSESDFAEKLNKALGTNGSAEGRKYVLENFNWDNIIKDFDAILKNNQKPDV